jgi:hypothetical protein
MSAIDSIMSLVTALSPSEKLQLNVALSTSMIEKAPSSRKGKPASMGIRAWTAFVAHVQATMPERFAPPALPKERLVIAGAIRLEDPAAYEAFCAKFKADAVPEPVPAVVRQLEAEFTAICATLDAKYPEGSQAPEAEPKAEEGSQPHVAPVAQPAPEPKAEPTPEVKPKKQLSPEHLAKLKAGREKKAAEKAAEAESKKRPATEAPEGAPPAKKARIE